MAMIITANTQVKVVLPVQAGESLWAVFLHKMGRMDQAIAKYQEALKLDPNSAEINYNLGLAYFSQKKYKEALPLAQKAAIDYEKELGANNIEVARAQRNSGYINYYLDDKKKAQKDHGLAAPF